VPLGFITCFASLGAIHALHPRGTLGLNLPRLCVTPLWVGLKDPRYMVPLLVRRKAQQSPIASLASYPSSPNIALLTIQQGIADRLQLWSSRSLVLHRAVNRVASNGYVIPIPPLTSLKDIISHGPFPQHLPFPPHSAQSALLSAGSVLLLAAYIRRKESAHLLVLIIIVIC